MESRSSKHPAKLYFGPNSEKKILNQRSSPKTTHFEKKNIQKKSEVFSCYMSPLNISKKLVDYHHFKAQKVIPRKKVIWTSQTQGIIAYAPIPTYPFFGKSLFVSPLYYVAILWVYNPQELL